MHTISRTLRISVLIILRFKRYRSPSACLYSSVYTNTTCLYKYSLFVYYFIRPIDLYISLVLYRLRVYVFYFIFTSSRPLHQARALFLGDKNVFVMCIIVIRRKLLNRSRITSTYTVGI